MHHFVAWGLLLWGNAWCGNGKMGRRKGNYDGIFRKGFEEYIRVRVYRDMDHPGSASSALYPAEASGERHQWEVAFCHSCRQQQLYGLWGCCCILGGMCSLTSG